MSVAEITKYHKERVASLEDLFAPIPNDIDRIGELILAVQDEVRRNLAKQDTIMSLLDEADEANKEIEHLRAIINKGKS